MRTIITFFIGIWIGVVGYNSIFLKPVRYFCENISIKVERKTEDHTGEIKDIVDSAIKDALKKGK